MSAIYAVVDKTKKKKNCSLPKKEMESDEAGSGLPLYAVVDKKKKNCSLPKKEVESDEAGSGLPLHAVVDKKEEKKLDVVKKCPNDYNSNSDMHTKNEVTSPTSEEDNSDNPLESKEKCISRKWIVTVLFISVILLLFTCVICICVAFLELSRLKSDAAMSTSSIRQLMDLKDFNEKLENISSISLELSRDFSVLNGTFYQFQETLCGNY